MTKSNRSASYLTTQHRSLSLLQLLNLNVFPLSPTQCLNTEWECPSIFQLPPSISFNWEGVGNLVHHQINLWTLWGSIKKISCSNVCHALLIIVFFHFYSILEIITLFYCSILFSTLVYSAMSRFILKSICEKVDFIWFVLVMTGLKNNTMSLFLIININILVWEKSFMD